MEGSQTNSVMIIASVLYYKREKWKLFSKDNGLLETTTWFYFRTMSVSKDIDAYSLYIMADPSLFFTLWLRID